MYYTFTKKKIILIIIIAAFILISFGLKLQDKILPHKITKEEAIEQQIDNNILIFSDGGLTINNSMDKSNEKIFEKKLELNNYNYELIVQEEGILDYRISDNLLKNKSINEMCKFEHVIIQCGLFDYMKANQIGDFDDNDMTMLGALKEYMKNLKDENINANVILIGPPSCKEIVGIKNYSNNYLIDYSIALSVFSNQYDNVYYIDLYNYTKDNPMVLDGTEEYVLDEKLMDYIVEEINKIDSEYKNNVDNENENENKVIIVDEENK